MKNICIIYGAINPYPDGGADFVTRLAEEYALLGNSVSILTSSSMSIYCAENFNYDVYPIVNDWGFSGVLNFKSKFYEFFKKRKFDKVLIIYPCVSVKGNKNYILPMAVPFIKDSADLQMIWFTPIPPRPNILELLTALVLYISAKKIISMDYYISNLLSKINPLKKIVFSGFGPTISIDNFKPQQKSVSYKSAIGVREDVICIGYFGYWAHSKGTDLAVDVLAELKRLYGERCNFVLLLIGGRNTDRYRDYDRNIIKLIHDKKLEDHVILTGQIPDSYVLSYLQCLDVFLMPYRSFFTSRSTLSNAINLGLPVVATSPKSHNPILINGINSLVSDPDNIDDLVKNVYKLATDSKLKCVLTKNLHELKNRYSWRALTINLADD